MNDIKKMLLFVINENAHKIVNYMKNVDEVNVVDIKMMLIDTVEEYLKVVMDNVKIER